MHEFLWYYVGLHTYRQFWGIFLKKIKNMIYLEAWCRSAIKELNDFDTFQDLESPPSSVIAVMNNRWLSNGFKETALQTAIWSVLKAKRRLLR